MLAGPLAIAGLCAMPDKPAIPRDTAKAVDTANLIEHRRGVLVTARHPFVTTAPTDLTNITMFNSPEFKNFRTSDSLVCRVNP